MILSTVKILVGLPINDNSNDMLIDYLIRVTVNRVLNYCNLKQLPQELELTVADMTANLIKLQYSEQIISQEERETVATRMNTDKPAIKKETIGDYSVEYVTDSTTTTSTTPSLALDDILSDYKSQLNRFRKIKL